MRIEAFNKVNELYKTNMTKSISKVKQSSFTDKLEISQTGKDYQVAKQIISNTPDIREDRVNEIKQRMASGTYQVSNADLAQKLADQYFDELV